MSFLLDPPCLLVLGAVVYLLSKRLRLKRLWVVLAGVVLVGMFIGVSVLLW